MCAVRVHHTSYVIAPAAAIVPSPRHTIHHAGARDRPLRVLVFSPRRRLSSWALHCGGARRRPPSVETVTSEACTRRDRRNIPVGSTDACGFAVIVREQPATPCSARDRAITLAVVVWCRPASQMAPSLRRSLRMKIPHILGQGVETGGFPTQEQPQAPRFLDRAAPRSASACRGGDRGPRVTPASSRLHCNAGQHWPSRAWMRSCPGARTPHSASVTGRATCIIHGAGGCRVPPATCP
jgi:hypothetical protein